MTPNTIKGIVLLFIIMTINLCLAILINNTVTTILLVIGFMFFLLTLIHRIVTLDRYLNE